MANAYEILSNEDKRTRYNKAYVDFYRLKSENIFQNSNTHANQKSNGAIINYIIWGLFVILIIYLLLPNETSTGNFKADKELKEQKNRPESGELDFNK